SSGKWLSATLAPRRANSSTVARPMPDAAPVTSAVLPSRSPMRSPTDDAACSHAPYSAFRPAASHRAERELARGLSPHFAEQDSALRLRGRLGFHDLDRHSIDRDGEIFHHRIGDVLDQGALLLERAALDGMNIDFRHCRSPSLAYVEG